MLQVGRQGQGLVVGGEGFIDTFEFNEYIAATVPGFGQIRPQGQGLVVSGGGFVPAIEFKENMAAFSPMLPPDRA